MTPQNRHNHGTVNLPIGDWPPRFTLSRERILKLLTGTRFYSDPSAALREAILNAIDAVRRRQESSALFEPVIDVTIDRDRLSLRVDDNGVGMDKHSITHFFATVGASLAEMEQHPQSVGEFGIGVVSYFMAGDSFELQTWDGVSDPIGLRFEKEMLEHEDGEAIELSANRTSQGTSLTINIRDASILELLVEKFSHWCRDVPGLSTRVLPGNITLDQLGVSLDKGHQIVEPHEVPDWVERSHLSPVSKPTGWEAMTGNSTVSVLYRGVFVQEYKIRRLWGIEGSIDVNPKHFQPRLNREGFVSGQFESEVTAFLQSCHPQILEAMVPYLQEALGRGDLSEWKMRRWANLWLSVPRSSEYTTATETWDRQFRKIPVFMLAKPGRDWMAVSLDRIVRFGRKVFVAPLEDEKPNDVVMAAVNYLRNTGEIVIRGIRSDLSWLRHTNRYFGTTADLIFNLFETDFPERVMVAQHANDIVTSIHPVAVLFTGPPAAHLVCLGDGAQPILRVLDRLIINIDHERGRLIVLDTLDANRGPISLVESTAKYAHRQLTHVAKLARDADEDSELIGPVRRRYIRKLLTA